MFVYSFCFFLSFSKQGWASVQTPNGSGGGATAPNPTRKLEAHFFWVGVASAAYPQLRRLRTCFIIFVKSQKRNIFFGGSGLGCIPPTSQAFAHVLSFFFKVAEAGEGFVPNPERKPCPPTPGDAKGARRGKREKGGRGCGPKPWQGRTVFCFLFVVFLLFFVSGAT
jgi:hypothetical protein